jgi:predicted TIM-barrel fold metal-dependent hydrolase
MQPRRNDALQLLRSANAWTVEQAVQRPERFRAFIAVDPLHPNGLDEIEFWRGKAGVAGVKIHLTSAAADLRRPDDLAKVSSAFKASSDAGLPLLVHLRTMRMDYGAEDVQLFLQHVAAVTKTPIQIAHAAGWGGVDAPTLQALNAFADALEVHPARFGHVVFDLSGVWTDKTPSQDLIALALLVRRIGVRRFLPASDWPFSGEIKHHYADVYPRLPLLEGEWRAILENVAPYAR